MGPSTSWNREFRAVGIPLHEACWSTLLTAGNIHFYVVWSLKHTGIYTIYIYIDIIIDTYLYKYTSMILNADVFIYVPGIPTAFRLHCASFHAQECLRRAPFILPTSVRPKTGSSPCARACCISTASGRWTSTKTRWPGGRQPMRRPKMSWSSCFGWRLATKRETSISLCRC